jgi:hypothetical protein
MNTPTRFVVSTTVDNVRITPSVESTLEWIEYVKTECSRHWSTKRELSHLPDVLTNIILAYGARPVLDSMRNVRILLLELEGLSNEDVFDLHWYDCGTRDYQWAARRLDVLRIHRDTIQTVLNTWEKHRSRCGCSACGN